MPRRFLKLLEYQPSADLNILCNPLLGGALRLRSFFIVCVGLHSGFFRWVAAFMQTSKRLFFLRIA